MTHPKGIPTQTVNAIIEVAASVLTPPTIALPLGVLTALALFRSSRASASSVTPDDRTLSLIRLAVSLVTRLVVTAGLLAAYLMIARESLPWFGGGIAGGFLVLANVELFRRGREVRLRREHLVPVKKEG